MSRNAGAPPTPGPVQNSWIGPWQVVSFRPSTLLPETDATVPHGMRAKGGSEVEGVRRYQVGIVFLNQNPEIWSTRTLGA